MDSFLKLLESRASFNAILQIGIDVVILGLLGALLRAKRPRLFPKDETLVASLEKIMHETAEISQKCEINLEKRQELLQQITAKLDERIQEGEKLCLRLAELSSIETPQNSPRHSSHAGPGVFASDQQKVFALARKGFSTEEIAKRIQRPVGEVELILNLRKIAS